MKFTVVWKPSAQNELAELWIAANDRDRVRAAADRIDDFLHDDALSTKTTVSGVRRVLIVRPLAVQFAVSDADRIVIVVNVVRIPESKTT